MTESPWARPAPPPAAEAKPANWGFYLLISVGLGIVLAIVDEILAAFAGFRLPGLPVNLAVAWAAAYLAGARYLKRAGRWDRSDRRRVALAYMFANTALALLVIALGAAFVLSGYGQELLEGAGLPDLRTIPVEVLVVVAVIALPLGMLINYGLSRVALGMVDKNRPKTDDISKEFA